MEIFDRFVIPAERFEAARETLRNLEDTLFIIPENDGEARRAVDILEGIQAPNLWISRQGWGAVLEKESIDPSDFPSWKTRGVKTIVIFEIPGLSEERKLEDAGFKVVIIDHHSYETVDRRHPQSSLEQLMDYIGWIPNRQDISLAVNDRGYIPGLKAMGLSEQEIRDVRIYDLVAQGRSEMEIERKTAEVERMIPTLRRIGPVYVIDDSVRVDGNILKQELALMAPDGLSQAIEISPNKIGFTGSPAIVEDFLKIDFTALGYEPGTFKQYSGGDPNASVFYGFKPDQAPGAQKNPEGPRVPAAIARLFESIIEKHVKWKPTA